MANAGKVVVLTCKECGDEFPHTVKGAGRYPSYCPPHAALRTKVHTANYRRTEKYRQSVKRSHARARENYNEWLWENTILEWNE